MNAKAKPVRPYALRKPCPKCPFRTDVKPFLRHERVVEMAHEIQSGSEFPCHETTEHGDEHTYATVDSKHCAGAMILARKTNPNHSTQMMRITERIAGVGSNVEAFDPDRLDMDAPVHDDWQAFVDHFDTRPESERLPHCDISGPSCDDPAGWMMGQVVTNVGPGTAEYECSRCGASMCADCKAEEDGPDGPLCYYCEDEDDDND